MSIREDIELYTKLSGEDGSQETIGTIGAYLRGYSQGKEDAEPHWIPVTERLPETYESVLVWSNGYICKDMIVCPYDDKIWYRCGKIEDDDYWMPLSCLPEPYKGVTE